MLNKREIAAAVTVMIRDHSEGIEGFDSDPVLVFEGLTEYMDSRPPDEGLEILDWMREIMFELKDSGKLESPIGTVFTITDDGKVADNQAQ